jgi:hypothetical protein
MHKWLTGEWFIERTSARRRRILHYWATILWLTVGLVAWIILRNALWFVGFMSLYAIWVTHIAGWAAETPVETEDERQPASVDGGVSEAALVETEPD